MADLVDPDPGEPGEQVALAGGLGRDALADRADRAPRDPQQLSDRALGALHRQPRRLVLEGAREARSMTRPRHRAHDHAVHWAAHPRRVRLDIGQRRAEIQRPPAPAALAEIEPRTAAPADPAAIQPIKARPGRHDHFSLIAEVDLLDDRGAQPQQPRPYPSSAHVVTASMDSGLREAGTLAARRRAHRLNRSPHPRQQHKRQKEEVPLVVAAPPQTRAHMWLASLVPSSLVLRDDESDLVGAAELLDLQARVVHDDRVDLVQAADAREVRGSRL